MTRQSDDQPRKSQPQTGRTTGIREAEVDSAVRLRRTVSRLSRRFNATAIQEGLTPSQESILGTISTLGEANLATLIEREHVNTTMLSRLLSGLYKAGLVDRRQHREDLRTVTYTLTPEGRAVHERVRAQRAILVLDGIEELSPEQQEKLWAAVPALEQLLEAIR